MLVVTCRKFVVLEGLAQHEFVGVLAEGVPVHSYGVQVHVRVRALSLVRARPVKVPDRAFCANKRNVPFFGKFIHIRHLWQLLRKRNTQTDTQVQSVSIWLKRKCKCCLFTFQRFVQIYGRLLKVSHCEQKDKQCQQKHKTHHFAHSAQMVIQLIRCEFLQALSFVVSKFQIGPCKRFTMGSEQLQVSNLNSGF